MANDDDNNIGDLSKVKQLTSSIRFESEGVRRQVEDMLTKYQDVADILGKTRELTRSEAAFAKDYLSVISRMSTPLKGQVRDLGDAAKALVAMEQAVQKYVSTATKAEAVSGRLASSLSGARKYEAAKKGQTAEAQQGFAESHAKMAGYTELSSAMRLSGGERDAKLRELFGDEAEGKTSKGLRRLGGQKLSAQRQTIAAESGSGSSEGEVIGALKAEVGLRQKNLDTAKKEEASASRRVEQLKGQKKLADQIKTKNEEGAKVAQASLAAHEKLLPKIGKLKDAAPPAAGGGDDDEGGGKGPKGPRGYREYGRRGLMNNLGLNVLSDVGIPGVSEVARVERYRRMSVDAAERYKARKAEESGEEGGGGLMAGAAGLLANPIGLLAGGAAVIGGFGVHKFRQAMGESESMTGAQRTLMGQGGSGRLGKASAAYQDDLSGYGLDMRQAQGALVGLNRAVGGRSGPGQLRSAAALGQGFGQDVGEIGGQAGALMRAGGASPQQAVKSLEKIMMEGVKAGMDRARITEFTSEVVGIQEQILREGGQNNAQAIAKSLAQLMGASGKQGAEFMNSAGFQGLMGIDRGMKGFSRGGGGQGMGTLFRAFAPGVQGQTPADRYVALSEKMEGGLFGGNKKGDMAADRAKQVIGQYFKESGAQDLFEQKAAGKKIAPEDQRRYQSAENVVRTRMQQEMGVGFGQSKELLKLMEGIDNKMANPDGQREVANAMKDMTEKTKDPLIALGDKMAEANRSLQDIAVSGRAIKGFIGAKDLEITANKIAKPMVEMGGDLFGSAVSTFDKAVNSFEETAGFIAKIFGKDETTPQQRAATEESIKGLTGKSLDEFKNQESTFGVLDMIKGLFGMLGNAAPPKDGGPTKYSPTGIPMTPDSLKTLSTAMATGDQSKVVEAINKLTGKVEENTAVTAHGNTILRSAGKSGNIGGAAGR